MLGTGIASAIAEDWNGDGCAGVVENDLKALDMGDLKVREVRYFVRTEGGGQGGGTRSLDGWVGFENCKGNMIVRLSKSCAIKERYTSGDCEIDGIPNY
jgi:hypothetical protein